MLDEIFDTLQTVCIGCDYYVTVEYAQTICAPLLQNAQYWVYWPLFYTYFVKYSSLHCTGFPSMKSCKNIVKPALCIQCLTKFSIHCKVCIGCDYYVTIEYAQTICAPLLQNVQYWVYWPLFYTYFVKYSSLHCTGFPSMKSCKNIVKPALCIQCLTKFSIHCKQCALGVIITSQ